MPGRPITDQQMRYYMTLRTRHTRATAAAMAGFSTSTGYRVERDPRLPSRKKACHGHGGGRPDPLTDIWDGEIVPLLERTPDLRPITIFEEMIRRHPERDLGSARRTLERRVRLWKARFGPAAGSDLPPGAPAGAAGHVGLLRRQLSRCHDCRRATGAPHLPLHPGLFRLGTCPGGVGRRELHGPGQRLARTRFGLWAGLCCKPDVGVSQIRTTTVLSSCFCVGQTVL